MFFVGWYMEAFFDQKKEKEIVKVFWFSNIKRGNYLNFSMTKVRVIFIAFRMRF